MCERQTNRATDIMNRVWLEFRPVKTTVFMVQPVSLTFSMPVFGIHRKYLSHMHKGIYSRHIDKCHEVAVRAIQTR